MAMRLLEGVFYRQGKEEGKKKGPRFRGELCVCCAFLGIRGREGKKEGQRQGEGK
jgi:hypothetical protein